MTGEGVRLRVQQRSVCRPAREDRQQRTPAVTQCFGAEEQGDARRTPRLLGDACADAGPSERAAPGQADKALHGVEQNVL